MLKKLRSRKKKQEGRALESTLRDLRINLKKRNSQDLKEKLDARQLIRKAISDLRKITKK